MISLETNGEAPRVADPFDLFVAAHREALPKTRDGKRFNSGEHAWLGGHGAERARVEFETKYGISLPPTLFVAAQRLNGREGFEYGELVALSGDFYETPKDLFEQRSSPLPWLLGGEKDLFGIRDIFKEELRWIEERRKGRGSTSYPDAAIRMAWNAKSYVELALRNDNHFGWHNMLAYCLHHNEALKLAHAARGRNDETFRRALFTNAFADHFLTDGFAAGHVRVPRAEIRAWSAARGYSEKVAGALSKLLHDQDGHLDLASLHGVAEGNRHPDDGLLVQDSTGATFRTRCDGQLFLETAADQSSAIERAVSAVSASALELLNAWQRRELPDGVYAATRLVPFPAPGAPTLVQKFGAHVLPSDFERLWGNINWYMKIPWLTGLERDHVTALFQDLPEIMNSFRTNVAADAERHPELVRRMDPKYVAAYQEVA